MVEFHSNAGKEKPSLSQESFDAMCGKLDYYLAKYPEDFTKSVSRFQQEMFRVSAPEDFEGYEIERMMKKGISEEVARMITPKVGSESDKELPEYKPVTLAEFFELLEQRFESIAKPIPESEGGIPRLEPLSEEDDDIDSTDDLMRLLGAIKTQVVRRERHNLMENGPTDAEIQAFKEYVNNLVAQGEVDEKVATFFLGQLFYGEKGAGVFYDSIVRSEEQDEWRKKNRHVSMVRAKVKTLMADLEGQAKEDKGVRKVKDQFFFGTKKNEADNIDYRLYLNPRAAADPVALINRLKTLLAEVPGSSIYFKFVGEIGRADSIVFYFTKEASERMGQLVERFVEMEQQEPLLMPNNLPVGVRLAAGMTLGCEPPLNSMAEAANYKGEAMSMSAMFHSDHSGVSGNKLYANILAMSFALARHEAGTDIEKDFDRHEGTESAGRYFEQLLKLTQIDPKTMMPITVNDGKVPEWVQKYRPDLG